jgi:hypothetical protein
LGAPSGRTARVGLFMKIKNLVLFLFLIVIPAQGSVHLHFMRKIIALSSGVAVTYQFKQEKAKEIVKAVYAELTKSKIVSKHENSKELVKYSAYGLRGIAGLLTFAFINIVLNHE